MNHEDQKKRGKSLIWMCLGIAILCLISMAIELLCNFSVMRLPADERGDFVLDEYLTRAKGAKQEESGLFITSKAEISWKFPERHVDKFEYDHINQDLFDAEIKLETVNDYGEKEIIEVEDTNPLLFQRSIVNVKHRVTGITLTISNVGEDGVILSNPTVSNHVSINKHRILIVMLLGIVLLLLCVFRQFFVNRIEFGFALIALVVGFCMLLSYPATKIGWDEESHFGWSYRLAIFPQTEDSDYVVLNHFNVTTYNWPLELPGSYEETEGLGDVEDNCYENHTDPVKIEGMTHGIRTAGIVFNALGIKIAKLLNGSFSLIYFMGRFMGLIAYVVVIFLAIRVIPVGKRILAFISLMPTGIFIATCFSYDSVVYTFIVLGIALILREWLCEDRYVKWQWILLAYLCIGWGALSKLVYIPLVFIALLIPKERYKCKRDYFISIFLPILLCVGLLGLAVIPRLTGTVSMGDARGGSTVDSTSQLSYILQHPIAYFKVFLKMIWETTFGFVFGEDCYRMMGHLPSAGFANLIPVMAIATILMEGRETRKITVGRRIVLFILMALVVGMIWTYLYIDFTPSGATYIAGVQGRYYRPMLPLLYIILTPSFICLEGKEKLKNSIVLGFSYLVLATTAIQILMQFRV